MATARVNVALLAALTTWSPLLAAERPWIEVRSPHFVVISDASEKPARKVAWEFEQVHSLVPRLWPWAHVNLARPTVVLAARDEASMRALLPEYWERKDAMHPSAFLITGRDRHYIAVRADVRGESDERRENPYRTAYWAYVMLVLEQSFEQPLPLWFSRGLTEVFANTMVRADDIELGRVIPWQLQLLREREPLSFQKVRAVDRESPYYKQGDKLEIFDAHAWAAIHFLMFADKGVHQAELNRYSTLLQGGTKPDAALAEAFPDLLAIEKNLDTYVRHLSFGFVRSKIDIDVKAEGFSARPLPVAEGVAVRAGLHVAMKRPAEARVLIEEGRKADPASPALLEAEGLLADAEDRRDDAKAAYAKAAEQPGAGYYALYRHAQGLHTGSPDIDTLVRIEAVLRRSVEKNPEYANAQSYRAEILTTLGRPAEAEGLARKAIELDPAKTYHHVALARVLAALDRPDEARREGEKGLSLAKDPEEQANARSFLDHLRGPQQAAEGVGEGVVGGVVGSIIGGVPGVPGDTEHEPVMDYDQGPRPLKITRPQYPTEALAKKIEGTVLLEILIDVNGRVARARVKQSIPALDAAAIQTVQEWRFLPAIKGGKPVATIALAPISFRISDDKTKQPSIASAARQYVDRQVKEAGARGPVQGTGQQMGGLFFDPQGADFSLWINGFKNEVYHNWIMPQPALLGAHGHVDFEFTVERDGTVSSIKLLRSAGQPPLDKAAENALKASRFLPLPADYDPPRVTMQVAFYYNDAPSPPK